MGENREGNEEGEEFGKLHGKALAIRSKNHSRTVGFVGSFNLAQGSLKGNAETLVRLSDAEAAELWSELDELALPHPELRPIGLDDCQEPKWKPGPLPSAPEVQVDHLVDAPSAHPATPLVARDIPLASLSAKPPVDLLANTLQKMLA